jgi:hypothetical protein
MTLAAEQRAIKNANRTSDVFAPKGGLLTQRIIKIFYKSLIYSFAHTPSTGSELSLKGVKKINLYLEKIYCLFLLKIIIFVL